MNKSVQRLARAEQWADQICTQLGKSIESIIDVGRLLSKAKAGLTHGEWGRIFNQKLVPFSQNTAGRLMAIANHPVLANSAQMQNLPPSWGTLYDLATLPEPTLKHALSDGLITPEMTRKAVKALLPVERKPERIFDEVVSAPDAAVDAEAFEMPRWADDEIRSRVQTALQPVRDLIEAWPDDQDFALLTHQLQQVQRYIERLAKHHEVSA